MTDEAETNETAEDIEAELEASPALKLYVRVGDVGLARARQRLRADQAAAMRVLKREGVSVPIRAHRDSMLTTSIVADRQVVGGKEVIP